LAAAMMLARTGARVTVFEAMDRVGGRTSRVEMTADDGRVFGFDRGPTFFLMPYVLGEIFAAAGERLEDHAELIRLDPMYRLLIGQPGSDPVQIDTTQDIPEMARRVGAINEADGRTFERFIHENRTKLRLSEPILRRAMRSPLDLVDGNALKLLPILKPHKSVHALLGEYFTDERVKLAVSFQSKYLGMSPFDCPSLFTILPLIEYEYGVWHPIGGCHALMQAMARVAESMGVEIRTSSPVEKLEFSGSRATGLVAGGEAHTFDAVVVNADATWAMKNLVPASLRTGGRSGYADRKLDEKKYSCSTFMMYLGMDGHVDLPHHTIYTSASYRANLEDIGSGGRLSDDPSIYVCNPSSTDPSLAPEGDSALYVLVPTPSLKHETDVDWRTERERMREVAYSQLERVFGIEGARERVVCEHLTDPMDWAAMNINHGATFNLGHQLTQMLHWRPQNRLKGFERTYLVGGGTHPGSGLPTIFLSSQISTRLLCDDLGLACPLDEVPQVTTENAAGLAVPAV
ncbi:MAG: phytoene desaturase family protein, partial [Planctomycetota bacterium]